MDARGRKATGLSVAAVVALVCASSIAQRFEPGRIVHGRMGATELAIPAQAIASGEVHDGEETSKQVGTAADAKNSRQVNYFDFLINPENYEPIFGLTRQGRQDLIYDNLIVGVDRLGLPTSKADADKLFRRHIATFLSQPTRQINAEGMIGASANVRGRSYNSSIDTILYDYATSSEAICSREVAAVPPIDDISKCTLRFFLPSLGASARVTVSRSRLVDWRIIRASIEKTVQSFVLKTGS